MLATRNARRMLPVLWLAGCSTTATSMAPSADSASGAVADSDSEVVPSEVHEAGDTAGDSDAADALVTEDTDGVIDTDASIAADTTVATDSDSLIDVPTRDDTALPVDVVDAQDTSADSETPLDVSDTPEPTDVPDASVVDAKAILTGADAAALDAYLAAYDGPFCDVSGCLIITRLPSAGSDVRVLGVFGWEDPDAQPMAEVPGSPGTYWVVFDGLSPTASVAYKLKVDGEWTRDPANPYVLFGGFGFDSALVPPGVGRIALVEGVTSPQFGNTRNLYVYLPSAYREQPAARFPVLYLNDGWNVFANPQAPFGSWDVELTADALMGSGEVAPTILVGVDTDNRMSEYSYTPIDVGDGPIAPTGADYADFLADTVRPLVDARFRTLTAASDTGIAGSSLGGIISMYVAWVRPDAFGRVGSFSGAYWLGEEGGGPPGTTMRQLIDDNPLGLGPDDLRVYFDSGDTDESGTVAYGSDDWAYTEWTRNALIRQGWPNRLLWDTDGDLATPPVDLPLATATSSVPHLSWSASIATEALAPDSALVAIVGHGHKHNEAAWKARFGAAMRFLYPPP